MQRIAGLAIYGSSKGGERSQVGAYVERTVSSNRQVRGSLCEVKKGGTPYQVYPVVNMSRLKLVRIFPDRSIERLRVNEADRVDLYEDLLPEDSRVSGSAEDEFEVEKITDVRSKGLARSDRVHRRFKVYWKGYGDPS